MLITVGSVRVERVDGRVPGVSSKDEEKEKEGEKLKGTIIRVKKNVKL